MRFSLTTIVLAAAICLVPASAGATDMGTSGGYTYIKKTITMKNGTADGAKASDVTAKCPGKTVSVGGGFELDAPGQEHRAWVAESSGFNSGGWFTSGAQAINNDPSKLTAWAICTKDSQKIHRYKKSSLERRGGFGTEVLCKKGTPTGGGVRVNDSPTKWSLGTSNPIGITQRSPLGRGLEPGWSTESEFLAMSGQPTVTDVTCVEGGNPKYPGGFFSSDSEIAIRRTECRRKQSITGGGFVADSGADAAHILMSKPTDGVGDNDKVPDDGWDIGFYNDAGGMQSYGLTATCR